MDLLENIDKNNLPQHLAIIMDGNGRWANNKVYLELSGMRAEQNPKSS
jgi:undecaprenyl diphosphate synthase